MSKKYKFSKTKIIIFLMIIVLLICLIPPKNYNSKYTLNIEGPYGDKEAYHPKVITFDEKWNGYKYWMSYTPYPEGNDLKENPCIAVSNDLINWTTPRNGTNPLDEPNNLEKANIYNSDAHLVYNQDLNRIECYWRFVNNYKKITIIYRRCSNNGINWSEKETVFTCKDRTKADCISPAIIYENGIYKMWYVQTSGVVKYAESKDGVLWENQKDIKIQYNSKLSTWHLDVIKTNKGYEMLVVAFKNWEERNDMSLYYTQSNDGIVWEKADKILDPSLKSKEAWDNKGLYRASFIYLDGIYYVFYSGTNQNYNHGIGLVVGKDIKKLRKNDIDYSNVNAVQRFNRMIESEKKN